MANETERSRPGVALHGDLCQYHQGEAGESRDLPVTPVTLYKSERVSEFGDMISVNERYISYPIRNGLIRVINQTSVNRILLRQHENHAVTELAFFNDKTDLLLSSGTDDHINIWKLTEEENSATIVQQVLKIVPVQAQRVRWHPKDSNKIAIMNQTQVKVIDLTNVSSDGSGAESIQSISINCVGHETQVNDISFTLDGNYLASASADGTVLVYNLWQSTAPCTLSPERSIVPFNGQSVTRIIFGKNDQHQVFFGTAGNRIMSIWSDITSNETPATCVQTLSLGQNTDTESRFSVELDQAGQFMILADHTKPFLYIVHLSFTAMGMRMDNLREFTLAYPILSMIIANRRSIQRDVVEMQLFCIQTMAIQQYHVMADECYLAPLPGEVTSTTPSTCHQTVGAVTTEDSIINGNETQQATAEASIDGNLSNSATIAAIVSTLKTELSSHITLSVQEAVRKEMQSILIPAIGRMMLHTTEKAMMQPLQQSIEQQITRRVVPAIQESIKTIRSRDSVDTEKLVSKIAEEVRTPVRESFRDCFKTSIIPSFQAATQKMLTQINATISKSLPSAGSGSDLASQLGDIQSQLDILIKSETTGSKSSNVSSIERQEQDIQKLLTEDNFDAAFQLALGAENVELVKYVCQQTELSIVLKTSAPLLSPMIILCLIQQLGCDIATEGKKELELDWLRDALLVLNVNHPSVAPLVQSVLQELQINMSTVLPEHRDSRHTIVQHILKSMLS